MHMLQKEEQERLMATQRQQLWDSIVGLSAVVEDHVDKHSKQIGLLQQDAQNQAVTQAGISQVRQHNNQIGLGTTQPGVSQVRLHIQQQHWEPHRLVLLMGEAHRFSH